MNRLASLRVASRELRASIFRSLPWGYRVAHAFTVLAAGTVETFGRAIGDVFLKRNVPDMPEHGHGRTLPTGYYRDFADRVFKLMVSKFHRPDYVEDAMVEVMSKLSLNPNSLHEVSSRKEAENFVLKSVQNAILNIIKYEKRRDHGSMHREDEEGEEVNVDFADPTSMHALEELMTSSTKAAIMRDLKRVLPWADGYFEMLLDGYNDKEIVGDADKGQPSMLAEKLHLPTPYLTNPSGKPMSLGMWSKPNGWKDKVKAVIQNHLE